MLLQGVVRNLGAFNFDSPICKEPNMSTQQSSTQAAPASSGNLRAGTLGFAEVISQSIANVSPTFTPSINVTAIAALAGAGTWLIYGLSTIGLLLVSMSIIALEPDSVGRFVLYLYLARAWTDGWRHCRLGLDRGLRGHGDGGGRRRRDVRAERVFGLGH